MPPDSLATTKLFTVQPKELAHVRAGILKVEYHFCLMVKLRFT